MLLYLLPTFLDLENGKFVNEEEPEIESEVLKDMTVDRVTEGNIPLGSSRSLSKLQGKSDDGFQSHDDHNDYIQIVEELPNQHREKAVEECDDMSVQSDIDIQSIPVLVSEHHEDKVQFGNTGVQTVDDFLDVRTNLEPEIREIVRLSNLRNLSNSMFENKLGLSPDPRFFNGSHSEYLPPPYGYLNANFAINQFMHNYPEQPRTPPNYPDMCRVPPNYLDMPRVPPNYSDLSRELPHHFDLARVPHMPPRYSELPRAQRDYSHMTRVSPSFSDLSKVPTGYPDFNHPRMPPNYALPYSPQGFYPNLAQTPQNRLCVPPPGFASHPNNWHSAANFALRPIIGQCHNTKPVRPPRFMSTIKPHSNSIQEVTEKLSDVSLFSSSISENSQNESNTDDFEKNNNRSAKLNNLNREKLATATDFSLRIQCRTYSPGDKNNLEANVKGEVTPPSISQSSNATNYTIDDSENDDDIYLNSSEYSLDLNGDSKLPWYKLELIDLADVAGHPVEVWHYKEGAYVILQQAASSIIDQEGNRILVNSIVGCSNGGIEGRDHHIIQDEYTVSNIMRSIEKSGRTSYTLGQQVKIMTKKHISLEEDFIILVPLMSLLDVFCTVRENFLVEISDLMKFIISMLKKHNAEKSDDDSDSDD